MSKFLQYELHKECKNGCKFCFNKGQPHLNKWDRIRSVHHDIFHGSTDGYTDLGFIGGELLDPSLYNDTEVFALIELWHTACKKVKSGQLNRLLITSALMFENTNLLKTFCDIADQYMVLDKILMCTSWDKEYRFTEQTLNIWENNMMFLYTKYPDMMLHVEMIMTGCLVEHMLETPMFITKFQEVHCCTVDFIQPSVGYYHKTKPEVEEIMPGFFPKRKDFIDLLPQLAEEYDLDGLLDMRKHADTVDCYFHGNKIVFEDRHVKEKYVSCLLEAPQVGYIDSDIPMRKDVEMIANDIY